METKILVGVETLQIRRLSLRKIGEEESFRVD